MNFYLVLYAFWGACLIYLIYAFRVTRNRKKWIMRSTENFVNTSIIHSSMARIVNKTCVDRAIILVAENGGPAKYGSVLAEIHSEDIKPVMNEFVRHKLDNQYMVMLQDLMQSGSLFLHTEHMPDHSLLKRRYEVDGITHGAIFMLHEEKEKGFVHWIDLFFSRLFKQTYLFRRIFYVSFSSKSGDDSIFSNDDFTVIESEVNKIIHLFKNKFNKP